MTKDFFIPLKKEDLLNVDKQCYSVELIPFSDVVYRVVDLKFSIEKKGCESILEHFDTCFSFLYEPDNYSLSQLQEFYDDVVEEYMKRLCPYVESSFELDPTAKSRALNIVKMILYLFSISIKTYEEKLSKKNENFISEPKKPRIPKLKGKNRLEDSWPWINKKVDAFSVVYSFLQLPISKLWQNLIVEDSLVKLIAGCCFKTIENSEINLVKSKPLRDSVCQVLSLLIATYNYTLTFLPRAVDIMKQHEHTASAVASTVLMLIEEFYCYTILDKCLYEFLEVSLEDPQTMGKSVSVFINDLGENHPHLFTSSVDILQEFLNVDAYSVRNAILITYCEMVIKYYSQENIGEDTVPLRNKILRILQEHINDENAYVRSKVVHLWTKLAMSMNIPVSRYPSLLRDMNHRLLDKSIYVSKNAINFFTTALEHNPYSGKLHLSEVEKEKAIEMSKLKELQSKLPLSPEERWNEIGMVHTVSEHLQQDGSNSLEDNQDTSNVDISQVIFIIASLINKNMYKEALCFLQSSEKVFPDSQEIRCNVDRTDEVAYYVATLKKIFLRAAELDPETIVPDYYENMNKIEYAKTVVKYLIECCEFIGNINKGSDTIYKLMFSKNNSEVLESIEFFSKAYKFNVGNSEKAVKDMLLLVNSTTPELKDAVGKAYGCLYLETSKTNPRDRAVQIANRLINLVKDLDSDQKLALEELLQKWISSGQLDKEFISALFDRVVQAPQDKRQSSASDYNAALTLIDIIAAVNNSIVTGNLTHLKNLLDTQSNNYSIKIICSLIRSIGITKKNNKPMRYKKDNVIFQMILKILLEKYDSSVETDFSDMAMSVVDLIFNMCYKPEELGNELLFKMYEKLIAAGQDSETQVGIKFVKENMLEKLFLVCGHLIFRKWQYCDRDVFNWLKRCHDGLVAEKQPDQSLDEYEMEADNVVAADEALYEQITSICEQFVSSDSTVQHISDLVIAVCRSQDDKVSPELKASASLALAKFMFVSVEYSESHFQLYMTLMDRCKHDSVRSNLVLSFGDLLSRFPNTAEPWTHFLYSRLKDHCELVRLNTVSVLCHLISREMIKVRGQISELLIHLEDPHPIIVEKVDSLLLDLSRKGNTVYNVIPDIISNLSNPERTDPVSSSTFKLVIGRLFQLITKERQSDLLVEKLCARLRESTNEKQWENLAYCLSQIRYSDKSLRKLTEAMPSFTERILHPPVHDTIHTIITTCSKSSKTGLKELAHEALETLEELMTVKDGDETMKRVQKENSTPPNESSRENEENNEEDNSHEMKTPAKPVPKTKEIRRTASKIPKTPRNKGIVQRDSQSVTRSSRKRRPVKYVSSDEED